MRPRRKSSMPRLQRHDLRGRQGEALIHTEHGATHYGWWCATSEAGVLSVLDEFYKNGSATNATFASATGHWDGLYVSRFYNYKSGPLKNGYDHSATTD